MKRLKFRNIHCFLLRYFKYILFVHILLLVVSIVGFVYEYSIKKSRLKEYLQEEFRSVILDELEERASEHKLIPVYSTNVSESQANSSIYIKTEQGEIQMKQDSLKRNIAEFSFMRSLHSTLLLEKFISLDSIYTRYMDCIEVRNVFADIALLYIDEKMDSVEVGDSSLIKSSNILACYYAGYCNEFEFMLFASIPFYIVCDNCNARIWIFIILLSGILLCTWQKFKSESFSVDMKGQVLQIGKFVYYSETSHELYRLDDYKFISINNRAADLLKAFITCPNHTLTVEQMKELVWNNTETKDSTVRATIKEVKDKLKIVDKEGVIPLKRIGKGTYSLSVLE